VFQVFFPPTIKEDLQVFIKYYDPAKEEMEYISRLLVKSHWCIQDMAPIINGMLGFPLDTPLLFFEEIKFQRIDPIMPGVSFKEAELGHGDIICVQKGIQFQSEREVGMPSTMDYYSYLINRTKVWFRPLEKPKSEGFELSLSKGMNFDQVVGKLSQHLKCDASKIQLTTHFCSRMGY